MAYRPNQTQLSPYNPYADIQKIYDYKNNWQQANKNNDQSGMEAARKAAQKLYASLRGNGYSNVADELTKRDFGASKEIRDYYAMLGKTATRPYLYSKAAAYGKTQADVDKLINWNDVTGQISFGGQLIGTPDTISSDGASYWGDTAALDKAFDAEAKNQGWAKPVENQYGQAMQSAQDISAQSADTTKGYADIGLEMYKNLGKNRQAQFDYANQDVTKTDEWKAMWKKIMPDYEYESDKAALNAAADSAATNSGNIDSFAAANARRQREASLAKGQRLAAEMGLASYQGRANEMNTANEGMRNDIALGGQVAKDYASAYDVAAARQNQIANDITDNKSKDAQTKLYDAQAEYTQRQADDLTAKITGTAPTRTTRLVNPFFNADGTVDTTKDYSQYIEENTELLNTEKAKPESEQNKSLIAQYEQNIANAEEARIEKTKLEGYKQYANDGYVTRYYGPTQYGEYSENEKDRKNALETITTQGNVDIEKNRAATDDSIRQSDAVADNTIRINRATSDNTIRENDASSQNAMNEYGSKIDNDIRAYESTGGDTGTGIGSNGQITSLTQADIDAMVSELNNIRTTESGKKYNGFDGWGHKTGMFNSDGTIKKSYVTTRWLINYLDSKNYSGAAINNILKRWGYSDEEIAKGAEEFENYYAQPVG